MLDLQDLKLNTIESKVFKYFQNICNIPHGSGNRVPIADFCETFAKKRGLKYIRDNENNVIIFKNGQLGGENAKPIILQGHLDMVCQASDNKQIDFLTQPITITRDEDFIKADDTTLGADNGIAVAYIMAILDSTNICHPPIEAIFTADEEIGLLGANALDTSVLKSKRMINLDSETEDVLTVSCAGGQDVILKSEYTTTTCKGTKITLKISGLLGGHSGVEIDKGRTNANVLMGKILNSFNNKFEYELISINGGKKPNAIPDSCVAEICTSDKNDVFQSLTDDEQLYFIDIQKSEPDFKIEVYPSEQAECTCFDTSTKENILGLLQNVPDGVIKMSEEIDGLVETSLNLGILSTEQGVVKLHYALRSNKETKLKDLAKQVLNIGDKYNTHGDVSGFYPPWEFKADSPLRELYKECYKEYFGKEIKVEAIHAGLECAVFSSTIKDLDCISVGPNIYDVHTPSEKLSISSAVSTFNLLLNVLKKYCEI